MSDRKSFPLRINDEIFAEIERWADDELRSTNGHIEMLLRDALRRAHRLPRPRADKDQEKPKS